MDLKLVYVTFPSLETAEMAVRELVKARLAACGNILPGLVSIYEWQGTLERAQEVIVFLKTRADLVNNLITELTGLHPYETPAILVLPVDHAAAAFSAWVGAQTRPA